MILILPYYSTANIIDKKILNYLGNKTFTNSTKAIKNFVFYKNKNLHIESYVGIYEIPSLAFINKFTCSEENKKNYYK